MDNEQAKNNQLQFISTENLTPMIKQYKEIKSQHIDKILFFRVGDFYEMFFDDAKEAADILKIALTSRNDVPMAGVPYHAATHYIKKLLQAGKKVAICEQLEDPAKAKGIVKRSIVNIITPGTIVEDSFILSNQNNFFASIYYGEKETSLTFSDVSTGEVYISLHDTFSKDFSRNILEDLNRFFPSEIITNESMRKNTKLLKEAENEGFKIEFYPDSYFQKPLYSNFDLTSLNLKNNTIISSLNGFANYLFETQGIGDNEFGKKLQNLFSKVEILKKEKYLEMDDFTIRNLELVRNMRDGSKKYTLLEVLDETVTSMGARLLRNWILLPAYDINQINKRLNYVEAFYDDFILLTKIRDELKKISDIERIVSRLILKRVIPRDLKFLSRSLIVFENLKNLIDSNEELSELTNEISPLTEVIETIENAITEDPPSTFNGEVIKYGFNPELDELRTILNDSKDFIIRLQEKEKERTCIQSLKIKYNQILGYFIEIPKTHIDKIPPHYIRKQSLVSAERFTLPELTEYEMKISNASMKISKLEEEIFDKIVEKCASYSKEIKKISHIIARLDVFSTFAKVALENRYVRPVVTDDFDLEIIGGRHPVVEKHIGKGAFVSNDTIMNKEEKRILIITGPNMAGKSTYLRQTALITIMAHIGSFVPAERAKISLVDKIFTRIGASDNLSGGESTFLIEMKEAARILSSSTPRSLIIMDELGRGTSTYDGLSIAWAVVEYLHEHPERCGKTLFATHYHELTSLADRKGIQNLNITVREYNDELIFLRKVVEGPSDRSYGIFVAKLAGIPKEIIERAKVILETLEKEGNIVQNLIESIFDTKFRKEKKVKKKDVSLELFPEFPHKAVIDKIKNLDINRMTPLEALNFLQEIKKELEMS
jgi:DNA mismatch repair protein MutS